MAKRNVVVGVWQPHPGMVLASRRSQIFPAPKYARRREAGSAQTQYLIKMMSRVLDISVKEIRRFVQNWLHPTYNGRKSLLKLSLTSLYAGNPAYGTVKDHRVKVRPHSCKRLVRPFLRKNPGNS